MKITAIASIVVAILLVAGVVATAFADKPTGTSTTTTKSTSNLNLACKGLTAGETLTVNGLSGHYLSLGARPVSSASGSLTFQVSTFYFNGCTVSITGGSLKLGASTFTITGGSIVLNRGGHNGDGAGTGSMASVITTTTTVSSSTTVATSTSTSAGSFLIQVSGLRGNSTVATAGAVNLDLKSGTSEFLVYLHS